MILCQNCESILTEAEVRDVGKPVWEAKEDVLGCADVLDYFAGIAPTIEGKNIRLN